ncbi:hypothetical protein ACLB1R_05945 [Escherichia coli]
MTETTSPDVVKSRHTTRKRTAKFVSLYGVGKFNSTVRFRLWHSRNDAAVSMAGLLLPR